MGFRGGEGVWGSWFTRKVPTTVIILVPVKARCSSASQAYWHHVAGTRRGPLAASLAGRKPGAMGGCDSLTSPPATAAVRIAAGPPSTVPTPTIPAAATHPPYWTAYGREEEEEGQAGGSALRSPSQSTESCVRRDELEERDEPSLVIPEAAERREGPVAVDHYHYA